MVFQQLRDDVNGCLSYLLGDKQEGRAVVVDPLATLGVETYLNAALEQGVMISDVIDTHLHADHLSIGPALAEASGARYRMADGAPVRHVFEPLHEGETLVVGSLRLEVLGTPGHTPEHIALLVRDLSRSPEPWFLLTGDSLFVGDVGRPDLLLSDQHERPEERARLLYQTLRKLTALADWVEIYPGHYGVSACGGQYMSGKTMSTIGFERRYNLALQQGDSETFTRFVLANLKPQPERYQEIKRQNMGEVSTRV